MPEYHSGTQSDVPREGRIPCLVIVGIGGHQKHRHYADLRCWGYDLLVVCDALDEIPPELADCPVFTVPDLHDHRRDPEHATLAADNIRASTRPPSGVLTLWEDCGPLAALIARNLDLWGVDHEVAMVVKSKVETQTRLRNSAASGPCALRIARLGCADDVAGAVAEVGLPALLKLEFGSSAAGVVSVNTPSDVRNVYQAIGDSLSCERDWPGIGLGFGRTVVLTELAAGTEHDVDIVLWDGEPVALFLTDNGRTRLPSCAEASALMPSAMPLPTQQEIAEAVVRACSDLGLRQGVFNVEVFHCGGTTKVIDVNGRMGGFYIRDWVRSLWGYDLLQAAAECAIGQRPSPSMSSHDGYLMGAMLLPSVHGTWLARDTNRARLAEATHGKDCTLIQFDHALEPHEWVDEPWGCLAAHGNDPVAARDALLRAWSDSGLLEADPGISDLLPPAADLTQADDQ